MAMSLRGVLGPVATPFDAGSEIDGAAFQANVRAHIAAGLAGIVVAGSTGEAALLDESERLRLFELAREAVPGDRLLVCGTGAESTRVTLRLTRAAAERGADAVLVVSPHYYAGAMSAEVLQAHFARVADESPVPVILYNIPKYTHFTLSPSLVRTLADHPNIVGIKDSSGDYALFSTYMNAQAPGFAVLTGSGSLLADCLSCGASGGILAVSLFAPALALEVAEAAVGRDSARATALQAKLRPLAATIVGELGIAGVKHALDIVGLRGGAPRRPLIPLDATQQARVRGLLTAAGVVTA